jgi:hypothetical protein
MDFPPVAEKEFVFGSFAAPGGARSVEVLLLLGVV